MSDLYPEQHPTIQRDAFWLLCGKRIGGGMSRDVYECDIDPTWVVKVESLAGHFQNVWEWRVWERVRGTDFERYFAPCVHISPNGNVLIQRRTTLARPDEYPERLPVFLSDTKRSNYGLFDGRLVCHDYGTALMLEYGMTKRTRKVEWWDQ